jgi:hypothetical protein
MAKADAIDVVDDEENVAVPAIPANDIDGLEDVDETDITIPRITIDHKNGWFVDSQTNETFTEFKCVILGLVKQRVLWPPTPGEEGEGPLCRAVDFQTGYPDLSKWLEKYNGITAQKQSGFTIQEVESGQLPCNNCGLKEWESHPNNNTPWCNEQFTFPLVRITDEGYSTALISFQKTGLKPCKSYISGFKTSKRPLYSALTLITAIHNRKGTVEYVTPSFTRISDSDPTEWPRYSESLHKIREFVTTPRIMEEAVTTEEKEEEETATPEPAKAAAKPAPAPVIDDEDEDEPF